MSTHAHTHTHATHRHRRRRALKPAASTGYAGGGTPHTHIMLPLAEKYRPKTLDEVRGQRHAVAPLKDYVLARNLPHLLLHGPAGTGKTRSVQCAVRQISG